MAKKDDIDNLVKTTMDKFGTIDILVNNAGLTWGRADSDFPVDKWENIRRQCQRRVDLSQQVARINEGKGRGKIIHVSSFTDRADQTKKSHPAWPIIHPSFAGRGFDQDTGSQIS